MIDFWSHVIQMNRGMCISYPTWPFQHLHKAVCDRILTWRVHFLHNTIWLYCFQAAVIFINWIKLKKSYCPYCIKCLFSLLLLKHRHSGLKLLLMPLFDLSILQSILTKWIRCLHKIAIAPESFLFWLKTLKIFNHVS